MPTRPQYDTYLTKGDCFDFSLIYKANGSVVDLTGYTAAMAIAWSYERGVAKVTTNGQLILAGTIVAAEGKISFHATAAQTAALPKISKAEYQVRIADPGGCLSTILSGNLTIYKSDFEAA